MAGRVFQIVGECAHVTVDSPTGRMLVLRDKGGLVDENDPRLPHLLDAGLVAEVGGDASGGVNADGLTEFEADQLDEVERRDSDGIVQRTGGEVRQVTRRERQAGGQDDTGQRNNGDSGGSEVVFEGKRLDGRSSKDDWVKYGVSQGRDRAALEALSKEDLQRELKPRG